MSKNKSTATKIWLVVAISLFLIGAIIFGGVMTMLKWDFSKLSTAKYETNRYDIKEEFENISIFTDTSDIVFVPSDNAEISVACHEQKNVQHSVGVVDGTLEIKLSDTRKWYEYIGISFGSPKITVYMPAAEYGALRIKASTGDVDITEDFKFDSIDISESTGHVTSAASVYGMIKIRTGTGDICLENISAGALDISVSTGRITATGVACEGDVEIEVDTGKTYLTDISCKNLSSEGDTGDITMKNVIAAERFSIERGTGDVKLDGCDAADIFIETDTGDVEGTLLSEKVFITKTDTGRVNVPNSIVGGRCEIETDTGDIRINIK